MNTPPLSDLGRVVWPGPVITVRSGAVGQPERGALVVKHAGDDAERLAGHLEQPLDGVAGVAHAHAREPRADDEPRATPDADRPRPPRPRPPPPANPPPLPL